MSSAEFDLPQDVVPATRPIPPQTVRVSSVRLPVLPDPAGLVRMAAADVRRCFLLQELFAPDQIRIYHTELDRASVGGALPGSEPLSLAAPAEFASGYFLERRELGVFNIGGPGTVRVDGVPHSMDTRDALYVGRGSRDILFEAEDGARPPFFYFVSYPAHATFDTRHIRSDEAEPTALGSIIAASRRTIRKYIHPKSVETCQLTMGLTDLEDGSVWNTMPAHRHSRRSEIYFYFDLPVDGTVIHLVGEPHETRHILVRNRQAVLSPGWSIHAGVGTARYSFIWAMGGENRDFSDMEGVPMEAIV